VQYEVLRQIRSEAEDLGLADRAAFIAGLQRSWEAVSRLVIDGAEEKVDGNLQERREAVLAALEQSSVRESSPDMSGLARDPVKFP
jgi:hypothetical protein